MTEIQLPEHPSPRPSPPGRGGDELVRPLYDKARTQLAVDGVEPRMVAAPADADEAARLLEWAAGQRLAVSTRGGGTRLALGNVPRALDLVLSTEKLNKVVEYGPADLTITVGAGTPFAEIERVLAERGQFLPLDPVAAKGSTIGGVIATNASGPFRLRYGSARDLVIGTQVATVFGQTARAGGKVVKNVTGYDLNKLYIGSLGTLAAMTELTFKVQPLPETSRTLVMRFPGAPSAQEAVYRTLRSPLTPSALELLNGAAAEAFGLGNGWTLIAHLGGFAKPVERMVTDLSLFARDAGATAVDPAEDTIWETLRQGPSGSTLLKIAVPIDAVTWALGAIADVAGGPPQVQASAGIGVIRVGLDRDDAAVVALVRRLRASAREYLGSVVAERASLAAKREFDVFGDVPDNFEVMRRLKNQLDPAGTMNPGRFLGRL
jgi:glycolate oxidase FAD binding subunit